MSGGVAESKGADRDSDVPQAAQAAVFTPRAGPTQSARGLGGAGESGGGDGFWRPPAVGTAPRPWQARLGSGANDVRSPTSVITPTRGARTPDYAAILQERGSRRRSGSGQYGFRRPLAPLMGGRRPSQGPSSPLWGSDHEFYDVREELEYSGHNLTSVLNNPREGWVDYLYEVFDPEQNYPIESYAPGEAAVVRLAEEADVGPVQPFLKTTGPLIRTFFRNHKALAEAQRAGREGGWRKDSEGSLHGAGEGSIGGDGGSVHSHSGYTPRFDQARGHSRRRVSSMTGISSKAVSALVNGGGADPAVGDTARCFEEVPPYFFDSEFSLQNPDMFEKVILRAGPEQQESLTHFLDLVEVCLLKQISTRSDAFFEGLETTHVLRSHVSDACRSVYQLRLAVQNMEADVVAKALEVPRLARRQQNLVALHDMLELAQGVLGSRSALQALLAAEDYTGALDIIEAARATLKRDLSELQCLKPVSRQLQEYEELVGDLLGNQFISIAIGPADSGAGGGGDISPTRSDDGGSSAVRSDAPWSPLRGGSNGGGSSGGYLADGDNGHGPAAASAAITPPQEERLLPVIGGLLRLRRLAPALDTYQKRLDDGLKLIIRTVVGDFLSTTDEAGELLDAFVFNAGGSDGDLAATAAGGDSADSTYAEAAAAADGKAQGVSKLKSLEQEAFASCLEMCFEHMLATLTRASAVHRFLADTLASRPRLGAAVPPETGNGAVVPAPQFANGKRQDTAQSSVSSPSGSPKAAAATPHEAPSSPASSSATAAEAVAGGTTVLPAASGGNGQLSAEEAIALTARSEGCLRAVSELIERSVGQLLTVRREYHATRLTAEELKALWDACTVFAKRVEVLSGASGYRLRQTLLAQAKAFVEHRHEANRAALLAGLDAERWTQVDVSAERQAALDRLSSGRSFLPSRDGGGTAGGRGAGGASGAATSGAKDSGQGAPHLQGSRERKKEAAADGRSYKVVWSALVLVEMVTSFLQFAAHFPAIATDVLSRVAELLRLFNSRTTQLVLGAGAIHSAAKLKSISAKHLALCSQALGLVRALIPHMRAALAAQLPPKHHTLLVELDKVSQDYLEHHDKIMSKFVTIIEELVDGSSASLAATDWDSGEGLPASGDPCQFIGDVMRGVTAMHKVLQQQLPPEQLKDVFTRIYTLLNRKLPERFEHEGVQPVTQAGRQRILDDVSFMVASLGTLRGVNSSSLRLEEAFRAKYGSPPGGGFSGGFGGGGMAESDL